MPFPYNRRICLMISYATSDAQRAELAETTLRQGGIHPLRFPPGIRSASVIVDVQLAVVRCDYLLLLLCPAACESRYVLAEVAAKLGTDWHNSRGQVITVKTADCTPPGFLGTYSWVDCPTPERLRSHLTGLARELKLRRRVAEAVAFMAADQPISRFLLDVGLDGMRRMRAPPDCMDCLLDSDEDIVRIGAAAQTRLQQSLDELAAREAVSDAVELLNRAILFEADDNYPRQDVLQLAPHVLALGNHVLDLGIEEAEALTLTETLLDEFKGMRQEPPVCNALRSLARRLRAKARHAK